jgi:hypothetical protein
MSTTASFTDRLRRLRQPFQKTKAGPSRQKRFQIALKSISRPTQPMGPHSGMDQSSSPLLQYDMRHLAQRKDPSQFRMIELNIMAALADQSFGGRPR